MSDHVLVLDWSDGYLHNRVECHAPEGADCRAHCAVLSCVDEVFAIGRDEAGRVVTHIRADGSTHPMMSGECSAVLWIQDAGLDDTGSGVVRVPIEVSWDARAESYVWQPAGVPVADEALW